MMFCAVANHRRSTVTAEVLNKIALQITFALIHVEIYALSNVDESSQKIKNAMDDQIIR